MVSELLKIKKFLENNYNYFIKFDIIRKDYNSYEISNEKELLKEIKRYIFNVHKKNEKIFLNRYFYNNRLLQIIEVFEKKENNKTFIYIEFWFNFSNSFIFVYKFLNKNWIFKVKGDLKAFIKSNQILSIMLSILKNNNIDKHILTINKYFIINSLNKSNILQDKRNSVMKIVLKNDWVAISGKGNRYQFVSLNEKYKITIEEVDGEKIIFSLISK